MTRTLIHSLLNQHQLLRSTTLQYDHPQPRKVRKWFGSCDSLQRFKQSVFNSDALLPEERMDTSAEDIDVLPYFQAEITAATNITTNKTLALESVKKANAKCL